MLIFFIKKCYVSEVKFWYYSAFDGCSLRGSTQRRIRFGRGLEPVAREIA
jgi:hypothetical protein